MRPEKRNGWWGRPLTLILLLTAVATYALNLGGKSLWVDESLNFLFIDKPLVKILTNVEETNPPLYYALLHLWVNAFGRSEVALRSLSVIFGLLAAALAGWLGWSLGGARVGWLTMGLMAFSSATVTYAQTARSYTLYLAATVASFACLLAWERGRERRWIWGYVPATVIMCYAHNYGIFNLAAQHLFMGWMILRRHRPWRSWAWISVLVLIGYSPWLSVTVFQSLTLRQEGFWIPVPALSDLVKAVRGFVIWGIAPQEMLLFYLLLAVYGLARLGFFPRLGRRLQPVEEGSPSPEPVGRSDFDHGLLLLLWFLVPIVVPFLWSRISTPIFWDRYTFGSLPAFYLMISFGVVHLRGRAGRLAVLTALAALLVADLRGYYPWQMENWRGLVKYVRPLKRPGDHLVITPQYSSFSYDYYNRGAVFETLPNDFDKKSPEEKRGILNRAVGGQGRLYLVVRGRETPTPDAITLLREEYPGSLAEQRYYGPLLRLYIFDIPGAAPEG